MAISKHNKKQINYTKFLESNIGNEEEKRVVHQMFSPSGRHMAKQNTGIIKNDLQ